MKPALLFGLLVCAALSVSGAAVSTDAATFDASLQPGYYLETFTGGGTQVAASMSFTNGTFAYTVTATGGTDVYREGNFIGNDADAESLTFTFTSGNVMAVGGNFYFTDVLNSFLVGTVSISLSDGTVEFLNPSSASSGSFRGFTSGGPVITSLTLNAPGGGFYNTADNLRVGILANTSVPEPATVSLLGIALASLALRGRCRR